MRRRRPEPSLGILLDYPTEPPCERRRRSRRARVHCRACRAAAPAGRRRVGRSSVIGAGNYAGGVLIPAFKAAGAQFQQIAASGSGGSVHLGRKFGFAQATTDTAAVLADPTVQRGRHRHTARQPCRVVLRRWPPASMCSWRSRWRCAWTSWPASRPPAPRHRGSSLMVGFNRRFAPQVQRIKLLLAGAPGPKASS